MKIVWFNVVATGHILPSLPLVHELIQQNHTVTYFGDSSFEREICETGADFRQTGPEGFRATHCNPGKCGPLALQPAALELLPLLLPAVQDLDPDLIVYDHFAIWGNYLAQVLDLPCVCFISGLVPDIDWLREHSPFEKNLQSNDINKLAIRQLQDGFGIETNWYRSITTFSKQCNLVQCCQGFHPEIFCQDMRLFHFLGPARRSLDQEALSQEDSELLDRCRELRAQHSTIVYVSLGTEVVSHSSFWRICIDAFSSLADFGVIVSLGRRDDDDDKSVVEFPPNFVVGRRVPQLHVLEFADAFVTHCGMNSTQEAIVAAVPLVCLPRHGDQVDIADQVVELDFGILLDHKTLTAPQLATATQRVISEPVFGDIVKQLQADALNAPSLAAAVDIICQQVKS